MNRAPKLYSFFLTGLAAIAFIAVSVIGCAAPIVPVANVVVDADVRDCSPSIFDSLGPLDVAIVIDVSQSTGRPTGFGIDRGDSRLAAQIRAVRPLFRKARGRDIRFSIVTFSGRSTPRIGGRIRLTGSIRDSRIRAKLTGDMLELDSVLSDVLEAGSDGMTIFFAGMQRGIQSLIESRNETRRKVVLFMSDAPRSNSLFLSRNIKELDPRMKNAAVRARGHGIVFHTFGLSRDSSQWRERSLGQIAGATGGTFHPIEDPRQFYCHLANSLLPSYRQEQQDWQRAFARYRKRQAASSEGFTRSGDSSPQK